MRDERDFAVAGRSASPRSPTRRPRRRQRSSALWPIRLASRSSTCSRRATSRCAPASSSRRSALPADGQPSPEEADRGGTARARAAREMGVLLAQARGELPARAPRSNHGGRLMSTADTLREQVRRALRRGGASRGRGAGRAAAAARAAHDGEPRRLRRSAVQRRAARRAAGRGSPRVARVRQPDRGRRAARGRDRARSRLGRRDRRDPVGEARRPDGRRLRRRHDRRDAGARAQERCRGGRRRTCTSSRA